MDPKGPGLNRAGSKVILWFLILAMLGFTVTRTLHFLIQTFPPDQGYVAYLALAAFDIGVLGWLYYATNAAEGISQRVIGYGMIFICAAGVIVTTIADMLMVSAQNGVTKKLPPDVATAALWVVMVVIGLNFFAGILVHLVDPKHLKHMAVEGAKDKIHKAAHAAIAQRAGDMAPRIAERIADDWENQVIEEMTGYMPSSKKLALPAIGQRSTRPPVVESQAPDATPEGEDIYESGINAGKGQNGKSKVKFSSGNSGN